MSEQNDTPHQPENPPLLKLQKLYIKDLSFESPNAPHVFINPQTAPKVEINLGLKNKQLDEEHWEVVLTLTANVNAEEENKTLFIIEIEHAGIFILKNIPEQHLPMVLSVDCATFMYPYTRQIVSQLSVDGGFAPFLLEPVNFVALYESAKSKKKGEQQQ